MTDQIEHGKIPPAAAFENPHHELEVWLHHHCCCYKTLKKPLINSMQRTVLGWAAVGFVIALWYLALSLGAWLAVSWIWSVVWIAPK